MFVLVFGVVFGLIDQKQPGDGTPAPEEALAHLQPFLPSPAGYIPCVAVCHGGVLLCECLLNDLRVANCAFSSPVMLQGPSALAPTHPGPAALDGWPLPLEGMPVGARPSALWTLLCWASDLGTLCCDGCPAEACCITMEKVCMLVWLVGTGTQARLLESL